MSEMERLLRESEQRILKIHGTGMPNERARQTGTSYVVQYEFGINDNISSLLLIATNDNRLCLSVFYGTDPDTPTRIYTAPDIYKVSTAESILERIESIIEQSTYEGYCTDINIIVQAIKDAYNM